MNNSFQNQKNFDETQIRRMTLEDLIEVYHGIEVTGQVVPWSEGTFKDCLDAGYDGWVIERGGLLEGYILAYVRTGECHILNFCVKSVVRGQGHGHKLLRHVLHYSKEQGAISALLEVRPSNLAAIHLYRKCGFNEVSIRKDYYATPDGGREDALVLVVEL